MLKKRSKPELRVPESVLAWLKQWLNDLREFSTLVHCLTNRRRRSQYGALMRAGKGEDGSLTIRVTSRASASA